jgi:Mce-associated membrane protein
VRWPKSRRTGDPTDTDSAQETPTATEDDCEHTPATMKRSIRWSRVLAYGMLPGLALLLAAAAGGLKWQVGSLREAQLASVESVRAATDGTITMLSYKPDTAEKDLTAAQNRLTGQFKDSYASLTHDVVIPGAKQKQISAVANVPAAASVSATANHAVVLVFVNQTVIVGTDAPTSTTSCVRVTLDKHDGRWLISQFEPI